jgi:hypothetical protein
MVARNKMAFLDQKNNFDMKQFKISCMKILILLLAIVSISCSNSKPIKKMRAKNIVLYKIADIPTLPEEQVSGKKYVLDYEVISEINTTIQEKRKLELALANQANYTNENNKKCVFMAKYAIGLSESNFVIVSLNPCSKIIVAEKTIEPKYFDLVNGNQIEALIYSITKPK